MSCPIDTFGVRPGVVTVEFQWFADVFLPHRLLVFFWSDLGGISARKMKPKFIQISLFSQACFLTVFPFIFSAFLIASSAAGPLISPPWAMNPWCAHLFAKSIKVAEISSHSLPTWLPKWLSQKWTRKISDFGSQNGAKMEPKRVVVAPFFGFQRTASIFDRL